MIKKLLPSMILSVAVIFAGPVVVGKTDVTPYSIVKRHPVPVLMPLSLRHKPRWLHLLKQKKRWHVVAHANFAYHVYRLLETGFSGV